MRCLFTLFAEDVGLLPSHSFTQLLADLRHDPPSFRSMVEHLWSTMNSGGFSVILRQAVPRFNGGLFAEQTALPLTENLTGLGDLSGLDVPARPGPCAPPWVLPAAAHSAVNYAWPARRRRRP
jgi:hypothetical protein